MSGSTRRNKAAASATSSQADKYAKFYSIFRDPIDVAKLNESVTVETRDRREGASAEDAGESGPANKTFRGLQVNNNGENQRKIFLATKYLVARIPEMVYGDEVDIGTFSLSRESKNFKVVAAELEDMEPSLKGVSGIALHAMYSRLIKAYKELEAILAVEAGGRFNSTQLMDLVKEMYNTDQEISRAKRRKLEEKSEQKAQAEAQAATMNATAISTAMQRISKKPMNQSTTAPLSSPPVDDGTTVQAESSASGLHGSSTSPGSPNEQTLTSTSTQTVSTLALTSTQTMSTSAPTSTQPESSSTAPPSSSQSSSSAIARQLPAKFNRERSFNRSESSKSIRSASSLGKRTHAGSTVSSTSREMLESLSSNEAGLQRSITQAVEASTASQVNMQRLLEEMVRTMRREGGSDSYATPNFQQTLQVLMEGMARIEERMKSLFRDIRSLSHDISTIRNDQEFQRQQLDTLQESIHSIIV